LKFKKTIVMNNPVRLLILMVITIFILSGCTKDDDTVKVGFLIHALDKERWENDRDYFIEKVKELGGIVEVRIAENDAQKQLDQANELLANGIDVLVVVPVDQFAAAEIVQNAQEKNVSVISYDPITWKLAGCRRNI
jgi:D-xylose transport system substrate-binding protein